MEPRECTHFYCKSHCYSFEEPDMGTDRVSTDGLDIKLRDRTDINFLKEGDQLRLVRKSGRVEILYATAAMDGHSVSPHYGKAAGTDYFDDPARCYINVKFDHVEYSGDWRHPNDSLKATGLFDVYVSRDVARRINEAKAGLEKDSKKAELAEKLRKAEEAVAEVRRELEKLA